MAAPLEKEAVQRLQDAKQIRALWDPDFREAYFFTAPHRIAPNRTSSTQEAQTAIARNTNGDGRGDTDNPSELQTGIGFEVATDFATTLLNAFVPQTEKWCELSAGPDVDPGMEQQIKAQTTKLDEAAFKAIKASNFYTEFAKAAFPDGSIGTMAMWIKEPGGARPIECLAAALRELYLVLGPDGRIDDRFVVRPTRYRYLPALLPGITLPQKIADMVKSSGQKACEVTWGFWRLWDQAVETWQHIILVDQKMVHEATMSGAGCCPLIVGRFNATSDSPWGYGPTIMALSDMRQADELEALKIEGIDFQTRPPIGFPDDSFTAIEAGIEPGMAYPVRPGSEGPMKELFKPGAVDGVMYETTVTEERIRRLHYNDTPTQRGKTPPTATQWTGELVQSQRRLGTPGLSFFDEFVAGVFVRFLYLLKKRGKLQSIGSVEVNGNEIAVFPNNPAQRAADMQEVNNALQLIEIGAKAFPEEWKVAVDGQKTIENFKAKLGDSIVAFRDPAAVQQAIGQISQLVGGAAPGAPPGAAPGMEPTQ
jgi:hypothetical protein